ncbi:hypothetical protein [Oenococcus kitaharae]|uniref:Putative membrane protein n=1 Tax=Oenococcus kitaharae DSM 17330 TaxID=1045004 RepID=G9WI02_9LACO|nr:hypothetical protein [Oenococcus kitaharae]EHN58887.1 Putative membrane protein [Oenococcus kitaharae DSM 17330]MCV3296869.1 hypothetical protein [Oenococcus kitaharae]OEY81788.1 membrane protein [Oenococcus kitaharae]OEY84019.1 membrane protein [Oenococcus kitaharae]OEY85625.1 membrane protein [Oenococcus kitaharae]
MNKAEWIEEFKKINGRDPRPSEFREALNRQEFSLDDSGADQPLPAVGEDESQLSRKEKRRLEKAARGKNRHNGINALILSMLSLLFTLSPILIVLNPRVILNAGSVSSNDNTGSFVAALFFFGVLLLLLSLLFAIMSLFESPRQMAIIAFVFSLINAFYVYTVVNFTQFSAMDFQKVVSIFQNIFR